MYLHGLREWRPVNWQTKAAYGCMAIGQNPWVRALDSDIGCTPALSVTHSADEAAVYGLWRLISIMPIDPLHEDPKILKVKWKGCRRTSVGTHLPEWVSKVLRPTRSFQGRCYRLHSQTNSVKALKDKMACAQNVQRLMKIGKGTSPTAACQSPKYPATNIFVRPSVANWIFRGFVAAHLAPAGFLSLRSDGLELTAWFVAWSGRRVWTFRRDLKTHLFAGH